MRLLICMVLCDCGRPFARLDDANIAEAKIHALETMRKYQGEQAYFGASTALIEIYKESGAFDCSETIAAGCATYNEDDVSYIRVKGEPESCLFRAILTHELTHIWLCRTADGCDHNHIRPFWSDADKSFDAEIKSKDCIR